MKTIITFLLATLMLSCGARKSNTAITSEDLKLEADVKDRSQTNTTVNTQEECNVEEEGGTYTPINPDKPMVITDPDGKQTTVNNGSYTKTKKKTTGKKATQATQQVKADVSIKVKAQATKKSKAKAVVAEPAFNWDPVAWAIGAGIILYAIYFIWTKKKRDEYNKDIPA